MNTAPAAPLTPPIIIPPLISPIGDRPDSPVNNAMVSAHNIHESLKETPAAPTMGAEAGAVNNKLADLRLASAVHNLESPSVPPSPTEPNGKTSDVRGLQEHVIQAKLMGIGGIALPNIPGEAGGIGIPGIPSAADEHAAPGDTADQAAPGDTVEQAVPGDTTDEAAPGATDASNETETN